MWCRFDGRRLGMIGAVVTVGLSLAGCSSSGEDRISLTSTTIDLNEVNDSGFSGQVLLASAGANRTIVIVALGGAELLTGDFPAAIHEGTCRGLSGNEAYALDRLRSGLLSQEISASLDDLRDKDHSLVVFQSDERAVYVACADL